MRPYASSCAYDLYHENAMVSLAQLAIDREDFQRGLELLRDVIKRNPARTDLQRNIDSLQDLARLKAGN